MFLSNFLTGILEGERPLLRMALGQIRGDLSELRRPREMVRQGGPGMHSGASFSIFSFFKERLTETSVMKKKTGIHTEACFKKWMCLKTPLKNCRFCLALFKIFLCKIASMHLCIFSSFLSCCESLCRDCRRQFYLLVSL